MNMPIEKLKQLDRIEYLVRKEGVDGTGERTLLLDAISLAVAHIFAGLIAILILVGGGNWLQMLLGTGIFFLYGWLICFPNIIYDFIKYYKKTRELNREYFDIEIKKVRN